MCFKCFSFRITFSPMANGDLAYSPSALTFGIAASLCSVSGLISRHDYLAKRKPPTLNGDLALSPAALRPGFAASLHSAEESFCGQIDRTKSNVRQASGDPASSPDILQCCDAASLRLWNEAQSIRIDSKTDNRSYTNRDVRWRSNALGRSFPGFPAVRQVRAPSLAMVTQEKTWHGASEIMIFRRVRNATL